MLRTLTSVVRGGSAIRVATASTHNDVNEYINKMDARDVQFYPYRSRDVYGNAVTATSEHKISESHNDDTGHTEAYENQAGISLNAVMQSNVPEPFSTGGKAPTHLNMPGGGWSKDDKYLSNQLQQTHYSNLSAKKS